MFFRQMTMTFDNRKRPRSSEDGYEFPIAKRMNNLHIRSGQDGLSAEAISNQNKSTEESCKDFQVQNCDSIKQNGEVGCCSLDSASGNHLTYNPDLDRLENPHYYNINSVLFNAHVQRIQRHVQMHPQ